MYYACGVSNIDFHADVLLDDFLIAENATPQSDDNSQSQTERASSVTGPRVTQPNLNMPAPISLSDGRQPGGGR